MVAGDANGGSTGETCNDLRVVTDGRPCGQTDDHAVRHHAGVGGQCFDLGVDFGDGVFVIGGTTPGTDAAHCGNGTRDSGEDLQLMRSYCRRNERARLMSRAEGGVDRNTAVYGVC